jgi:hypothetical protein
MRAHPHCFVTVRCIQSVRLQQLPLRVGVRTFRSIVTGLPVTDSGRQPTCPERTLECFAKHFQAGDATNRTTLMLQTGALSVHNPYVPNIRTLQHSFTFTQYI